MIVGGGAHDKPTVTGNSNSGQCISGTAGTCFSSTNTDTSLFHLLSITSCSGFTSSFTTLRLSKCLQILRASTSRKLAVSGCTKKIVTRYSKLGLLLWTSTFIAILRTARQRPLRVTRSKDDKGTWTFQWDTEPVVGYRISKSFIRINCFTSTARLDQVLYAWHSHFPTPGSHLPSLSPTLVYQPISRD